MCDCSGCVCVYDCRGCVCVCMIVGVVCVCMCMIVVFVCMCVCVLPCSATLLAPHRGNAPETERGQTHN